MAKGDVHLAVGYFDKQEDAELVFQTLDSMNRFDTINLVDIAMLTKDEDGKLKTHETEELTTGKGARRGALIMGVVGLIYPPSFIASVLVGGGIGAFTGRIRDTGIKKDEMKRVADELSPGMLAVAMLTDDASMRLIVSTIEAAGGKLDSHELGEETAEDVMSLAEETVVESNDE